MDTVDIRRVTLIVEYVSDDGAVKAQLELDTDERLQECLEDEGLLGSFVRNTTQAESPVDEDEEG